MRRKKKALHVQWFRWEQTQIRSWNTFKEIKTHAPQAHAWAKIGTDKAEMSKYRKEEHNRSIQQTDQETIRTNTVFCVSPTILRSFVCISFFISATVSNSNFKHPYSNVACSCSPPSMPISPERHYIISTSKTPAPAISWTLSLSLSVFLQWIK